jgi:hypothetical protein
MGAVAKSPWKNLTYTHVKVSTLVTEHDTDNMLGGQESLQWKIAVNAIGENVRDAFELMTNGQVRGVARQLKVTEPLILYYMELKEIIKVVELEKYVIEPPKTLRMRKEPHCVEGINTLELEWRQVWKKIEAAKEKINDPKRYGGFTPVFLDIGNANEYDDEKLWYEEKDKFTRETAERREALERGALGRELWNEAREREKREREAKGKEEEDESMDPTRNYDESNENTQWKGKDLKDWLIDMRYLTMDWTKTQILKEDHKQMTQKKRMQKSTMYGGRWETL